MAAVAASCRPESQAERGLARPGEAQGAERPREAPRAMPQNARARTGPGRDAMRMHPAAVGGEQDRPGCADGGCHGEADQGEHSEQTPSSTSAAPLRPRSEPEGEAAGKAAVRSVIGRGQCREKTVRIMGRRNFGRKPWHTRPTPRLRRNGADQRGRASGGSCMRTVPECRLPKRELAA